MLSNAAAPAHVTPPLATLVHARSQRLVVIALVIGRARIAEVDGRQEDLDAELSRLADAPVGVLEVGFVRRGEAVGDGERRFAIAVDRPVELVLDQIDDERVEALGGAVRQILLDLLAGQGRDEGRCRRGSGTAPRRRQPVASQGHAERIGRGWAIGTAISS
jgi:hypothetical protein